MNLTEDEQRVIALSEDAERLRSQAQTWALLAERTDHGPSAQIAENFKETYEKLIAEVAQQIEALDVDQEALQEKLDQQSPEIRADT